MKRFLCVILCLMLTALSFSACAGSGKNEETAEAPALAAVYDSAYSGYDAGIVSAYESLCSAVFKGEESVRFNVGFTEKVRRLFYTSFPLNALVESVDENEDRSGVKVVYKLSKEEHLKAVEDFIAKVNAVLEKCKDSNKNVTAIKLYNYIASGIQPSEDKTVSCYDTLMKSVGSSYSYAQLLSYLLQLCGIKSCYVLANDALGVPWGLVQAEIKGSWYYLDPMTEFYDNTGKKLMYFGMTEKDIKKEGLTEPVYSDNRAAKDASSLDFDACRYCNSFEIKDNNLIVTTTEGLIVQIVL